MVTLSRIAPLLAAAVLALPSPIEVIASSQSPAVTKLLAEARQALGGDASRANITSFKVTGSVRAPNRWESGSFEIVCVLPDRFLQIESRAIISPGETVSEASHGPSVHRETTRLGFNGDGLIFEPAVMPTPALRGLPLRREQTTALLKAARTGFANLTLALFAESFAGVPLHFGEATGPDSDRSVEVAGPDVTGTLTFDRQTGLPERFARTRYDDYRDVSGRKVPFRITDGHSEWLVSEFIVNVNIADKVFRPTSRASRH
jgi:hypothetical protein